MPFDIKLDTYEGPLDLLLHLIKSSAIDIYNIPIAEITDQYIKYLRGMEELNLDIASEFIVMAATLLEIKSKMLLPKQKVNEEEEEEDPRKELVEKLIEYKKYKEFAKQLKSIEENNLIYFKEPEIITYDNYKEEVTFKNITVQNLMVAFKKVMDNYEKKFNETPNVYQDVAKEEYKIEDKILLVTTIINENKKLSFNYFFTNCNSKMEIVVTFLAVLELIRLKYIRVSQECNFNDILLERQEPEA